ncbi:MAG: beta-CASP ribonuclease aCPSF1 [DPANN group archaeon]|nr:beta-CASP ribonuclease aCPSF1 [DPANN group archaeon]
MAVIDEILKKVPDDAHITSSSYEGANIIIYTKSKSFFLHGSDTVMSLVNEFKKRIDLRADSSIRMDAEDVKNLIEKTIPEEAEITQILFEPARSLVTIEAKKPGLAIGKDGDLLKEIKEKSFWTPFVRRESVIPSKITQNIRSVLYQDSEWRRKFLDRVGKRIYEVRKSTIDEQWARVSFLGAARQVGRSCFLLQTPESKILFDCGINVAAHGKFQFPYLNVPEFHIQDIDAVVISHSHLDHMGFLPYLFKMGYDGPVYCTEATRDVMALLMLDYIEIGRGENNSSVYSSADVKETVKHCVTLEFGEVTDITPDVRLTLYNAGHILGSALCHFHIGEGWYNFMYTGDFKQIKSMLFDGAHSVFPRLETLMMESTYGGVDNVMPAREESEKKLIDLIKETIKKKGKVLIPSLGVGRSQEIMLILEKFSREEKIDFPIYLDGMVWDISAIHNAYPRFLGKEVKDKIFYEGSDPFLSKIFRQVGSHKERMAAIEGPPCVIIATSGMLTGGPSVQYFKQLADNPKNSMVFVNYLGEGTLGREVQGGAKQVTVDNEKVEVKLKTDTIEGFSGHCDRNELMNYVKNVKPRPRKVIIVHGEQTRCLDLASSLHKEFKIETIAPKNLEVVRLK